MSLIRTASLLALLAVVPSLPAQGIGALSNPTGHPLGGGEDYGDWISPSRRLIGISTRADLLSALANATTGTLVYVRDDAEIDLTDDWYVPIHPGVTLASGRGRNGSLGGLIYTRSTASNPLFTVQGTGVRITGLRLRGPDTEIAPTVGPYCGGADARGIAVEADTPVQWSVNIDNNELWGWPSSAVSSSNVMGTWVHHNHIHHNRRQMTRSGCRAYGLGYGVVVSNSGYAVIEANCFDHNRHDIACDGRPGTAYEARYNLVLGGPVQHSFDVHGGADRGDGTDIAGTFFYVHHNTFLQSDKPAFRIRGVPSVGAFVTANEFRHSSASDAANQVNASGAFYLYGNAVGVDRFPAWFISFAGRSYWSFRMFEPRSTRAVAYGDFDGNGTTDAFAVTNGQWQISDGARSPWRVINGSSIPLSSLRFGDFDGDRRTDVFYTNGSIWYVSYAGTSAWTAINASSAALGDLGFGDFNGDGRTDVFYANGSRWYVSWSGTSLWQQVNTSAVRASTMRFCDFDGDGRCDVFRTDGSTWYLCYAASSAWTAVNHSTIALSDLAFADFDGDRRTDVFYANGSAWYVSSGATTAWQFLNTSTQTLSTLAFGDFNGDRRADVLSIQHP